MVAGSVEDSRSAVAQRILSGSWLFATHYSLSDSRLQTRFHARSHGSATKQCSLTESRRGSTLHWFCRIGNHVSETKRTRAGKLESMRAKSIRDERPADMSNLVK